MLAVLPSTASWSSAGRGSRVAPSRAMRFFAPSEIAAILNLIRPDARVPAGRATRNSGRHCFRVTKRADGGFRQRHAGMDGKAPSAIGALHPARRIRNRRVKQANVFSASRVALRCAWRHKLRGAFLCRMAGEWRVHLLYGRRRSKCGEGWFIAQAAFLRSTLISISSYGATSFPLLRSSSPSPSSALTSVWTFL